MTHSKAKQIPVIIASTLKPIQDVRAFNKLALSLGETNKYTLNIIGFSPKKPEQTHKIRFFSSMSHYHSTMDRMLAQLRFLYRLVRIRPKLVIACTYEYLPICSLVKPLFGFKLVYDVQENYRKNLDLNPALSLGKKQRLNKIIAIAESSKKIDLFLLAESSYQNEMPEKRPSIILENKYQGEIRKLNPIHFSGKTQFTFSITGTLTPAFGIREGIEWFRIIKTYYPQSCLNICGHVPIPEFIEELKLLAGETSGINLSISETPIPHSDIIKTLEASDFALLPYRNEEAIKDKMPTKLYECVALGVPVLIAPNPLWEKFLSQFQGGFSIDFSNHNKAYPAFQQALRQSYFSTSAPKSVLWKSEKSEFQQAISKLLS
jgi:hypothetical protein